jgi:hypothetical protein
MGGGRGMRKGCMMTDVGRMTDDVGPAGQAVGSYL